MKAWTLLIGSAFFSLSATQASQAQEAQCFQNGDYLVVAQERSEDVGSDILVRAPATGKIKCALEPAEGDFVLDTADEALWYAGLAGKYLALTRSTGPDGDIVVYDLSTRAVVIDVPADDDLLIDEDRIVYWERVAAASADTCPEFAEYEANGFGAVIAEERVLDVHTGEIGASGESRCSATQ